MRFSLISITCLKLVADPNRFNEVYKIVKYLQQHH